MDQTPNLALPLIAPDQAQKHLTHNEALRVLDAVVQMRVLDRDLAAPPMAPTEGDRYIVAAGATDAWSGKDTRVAAWQDGGWVTYPPGLGWIAFVMDEGRFVAWTGVAWAALDTSLNPAPLVGVNTTADPVNRLAVKSDAVLFSHDDVTPGSGHMRLAVNKATPAGDASLAFQTGYSARALIGTLGDDSFAVKVSPDGATYQTALTVDPTTGRVATPQGLMGTTVDGALQATTTGVPALTARANGSFAIASVRAESNTSPSGFSLEKCRGTLEAPSAVQAGDGVASVTARAFDGASWPTCGVFRFNVETFTGVNDFTTNWQLSLRGGTSMSVALMVTAALNLGVGTNTPSTRLHVAGPVRHQVYSVATLPAAATVGAGTRAAVTDAMAASFGAVVSGGGATFSPVISDGTNWRIG
jgi:hypothetical protein